MKRLIPSNEIRRSGVILVVAMICLFLASALVATLLKMTAAQRRFGEMDAAALQADWLADSALDRAAAMLAENSDYPGETWSVPAEDLDGRHPGRVTIEVVPVKAGSRHELKVIAQYPAEGRLTAQRTKRIFIAVSSSVNRSANEAPAKAEKPDR